MSTFQLPEKYRNLFIHRKSKDLIEAEAAYNEKTGKVNLTIFRSNNGITGEILSDGIFEAGVLPVKTDNVLKDMVALNKYLNAQGYKGVTKVTQTENGIKFD